MKFRVFLLGVFLLLLLPMTLLVASKSTEIRKRASSIGGSFFTFQTAPPSGSNIYFDPFDFLLENPTPVKIMVNVPSNQIAFARIVFTFDTAKVRLSSEISTSILLSTVVEKTNMSTANTQGKAVIVVAASPADIAQSGNFELAAFTVAPAPPQYSDPTELTFSITDMQIVDKLGTLVNLTPTNATVRFTNVLPTNPPIPSAVAQPSEIPIPSVSLFPTEIPLPSATIVPSSTIRPIMTDVPALQPTGEQEDENPEPSETEEEKDKNGSPEGSESGEKDESQPEWAGKPEETPCRRVKTIGCLNEMKDEIFGRSRNRYADLNNDGKVNVKDIIIWLFARRNRD
ncbi:MAG TPA: hypothetical protein VJC17_00415 [Candidatus Dojkabacteria bacterium]|nr:hypothetical protein [Candidatus Dojkabacteria bacterium]